jgi:acetate kinase
MADFAIVLNAGSSSLKFSIYGEPEGSAWRLEARGQIDGIGSSPRFTASDGAGVRVAMSGWTPAWTGAAHSLFSRAGSARVTAASVCGGRPPRRPRRAAVRPADDRHARSARESPSPRPLWRPSTSRSIWDAIEAVTERLPGVPQVACFDTSFHRGQPAVAEIVPLPRELAAAACSVTGSTASRTSTSPRFFRRWRRSWLAAVRSSPIWAAAPVSAR